MLRWEAGYNYDFTRTRDNRIRFSFSVIHANACHAAVRQKRAADVTLPNEMVVCAVKDRTTARKVKRKMKHGIVRTIGIVMLVGAITGMVTGCSTTSSTRAHTLKATTGTGVDLSKYQVATVLPFEPATGSVDASIGLKFAEGVTARLQKDYGPLFNEVRKTSPLGREDELVVTGVIRAYKPGDRFARAMLIGLGAASFKGDLILKDGQSNRVLLAAPFDKLWAWGGMLGASRGIEEMVAESEAVVAATVAQAKGWNGSTKGKEGK